jgi:hypothetical protein
MSRTECAHGDQGGEVDGQRQRRRHPPAEIIRIAGDDEYRRDQSGCDESHEGMIKKLHLRVTQDQSREVEKEQRLGCD